MQPDITVKDSHFFNLTVKGKMVDEFSFRRRFLYVLGRRDFHRTFIILLFVYYGVVYYFGELVDIAGWESLRWDFFYGVHDVHRIFFLIPVVYVGYIFRVKWALITTLAAFLVFLPRALVISPYSDPVLRIVIFTLVSGIIGTLTGMVRNESETRNRLENLIKSERDKLLGILERMEDGVIIIGPDYRIRFMNPSMVREFGDGLGSYCYQHLHDLDEPRDDICKIKNVKAGSIERWECPFTNGRTYDVIASPFIDSDGEVCQLATFRNITQMKKIETELMELNQLKSDLLSNASHELRSPLTSIKGTVSSLLQKDIELDEATSEMLLTGISEETDRLISLVTNLLNMSRLDAGVWKPEKGRCYITDIISDVLEREKWVQKEYIFETQMEPTLPEIYADYNQIRQVMINLLENATAYSEEGTTITIAAKAADDMVEISVSDNGKGIPQEDLDKVFDKFYRGSQNRQKPGGTGLGLAICRAIIDGHGGRIRAESIIGQGSTISFRLPFALPSDR